MKSKALTTLALMAIFCLQNVQLFAQYDLADGLFQKFQQAVPLDSSDSRILFLCRSGQNLVLKKQKRLYFNEVWADGMVLDHSNQFFDVDIKYRLYDGEMIIKVKDDPCVLQRPTIQALQFGGMVFVSLPFENEREEEDHGYFELITDGKIRLLRKFELKGERLKHCYFIQFDNGSAKPFKPSQKAFLALMSDHHMGMKYYLDEHDVSWKDVNDLRSFIDYYHRLLATD
ncbi:MAG: hypothetical protein GYB31_10690 [Bacteroidetes bacterium]|nr:hypothetical protein [Bacteroidota bacterium]